MIGYRARLGMIIPSVNAATEAEVYQCLPQGVTAHFTRMQFKESTEDYYHRMLDDVPASVEMLSHAKVNAMLFACTSGSFYGGVGYDGRIMSVMSQHTTAPVSTTSTSVVEALLERNLDTISIVTPYPDWINQLEQRFFEQNGIRVTSIAGMGLNDCNAVLPEDVYRYARRHVDSKAKALFISCMGLHTLEILATLERDLGMPVLSSNQVSLWKLMRLAGLPLREVRCDFGSLFKEGTTS